MFRPHELYLYSSFYLFSALNFFSILCLSAGTDLFAFLATIRQPCPIFSLFCYQHLSLRLLTIELRLYDEKRQQIKEGDVIFFTHTVTGEALTATVKKLHRFDSFKELYRSLPLLQCGYTAEDIDSASPADMEAYYSKEEQAKYGVVGIELC